MIDAVVPERTAYRNAIGKGLTILEAQPVSVRRDARGVVNAIIEAYMDTLNAREMLKGGG